jgi:diguanylate cyclase (GGDEF)-like protein
MANSKIILLTLTFQLGLGALVWLGMARLTVARQAAWHWAAGSAAVAIGFGLVLQRDDLDPWIGHVLANALVLAGFVAMHRGVEVFTRTRPGDAMHAGLLVCTVLLLVSAQTGDADRQLSALVTSASIATTLLTAAALSRRTLHEEVGAATATLLALPMALVGGLLALRAVMLVLAPEQVGLQVTDHRLFNLVLGLAVMAAMTVLNVGFGAMVVLRIMRQLQTLSERDPLTGLLNRRGLDLALQRESARAQRSGLGLAALSIDIDHFKLINDRLGHSAGDAVLEALARTLQSHLRDVDRVARTGGEEFCVLLCNVDEAGAALTAQRLLVAVRAQGLELGGQTVRWTVSVGVAVAQHRGEEPAAVLQRADAALYLAKREGRDRARIAPVIAPATASTTPLAAA